MNTIIYAGPSLTPLSKSLIESHNLDSRPPVRRGDIEALNNAGFKGTIIMVDGRFKEVLAVGHAEIREAISNGCTVFGLSSMGAIRAYEMESLGMKGFGKVFNYFKQEEDFQDDEVALLHSEAPYYYPFSEPLVHFRECVQDLINNHKLNPNSGETIIDQLKSFYFGERTMDFFLELIHQYSDLNTEELKDDFDKYRIKNLDLNSFLENKLWD